VLNAAINTWFATDQGKTCLAEPAAGKYLKNRLEAAFIAGWDARKALSDMLANEMDSYSNLRAGGTIQIPADLFERVRDVLRFR
jgi:hypothetical protein